MTYEYITKIICAGYDAQYNTAKDLLESGQITYKKLYEYLLNHYDGNNRPDGYSDILDMLEGWCDPQWSLKEYKTRIED